MKLGKRLTLIESMVTSGYTHIWDCCCDHGLLGAALLDKHKASTIHFVDIVPTLMDALEAKLHRFYPKGDDNFSASQWQVHCGDVASIPVHQFTGRQLVIIAGVGWDLMVQLIDGIHKKNPAAQIDYLLCPVNDQFYLRKHLINLDFKLITEALVEENRRFYEVLLVSSSPLLEEHSPSVTPVGHLIWQRKSDEQVGVAIRYLTKTLKHYHKIQQGSQSDVSQIIDAYQAKLDELNDST